MISYEAKLSAEGKPYIAKILTVGDQSAETRMSSTLAIEELNDIPLVVITDHIQNALTYIQSKTASMTVRDFNAPKLSQFPFAGWDEVNEVAKDARDWDDYAYINRDSDEEITE